MIEENNNEALPKPATRTRPYLLQRQPPPGVQGQTCLAGAPGGGAEIAKQRGEAPGLSIASYCHKTPPNQPAAPLLLTYYQGASLVDLQRPHATLSPAKSRASKRQKIEGWSFASRNHCRRFFCTLRTEDLEQALALTLTYPHDFPSPEQFRIYKDHLRVFNQGLSRRFPHCSGVWKLEFQRRGAAHFHIAAFGLQNEDLATVRAWVTARWYAIAHAGDKFQGCAACQVNPIQHHGGFINYMAKYIAKKDQTRPGDFTGRYWGVFAKTRLPFGKLHTIELTARQWAKVRRLMRKKAEIDVTNKLWKLFLNDRNPRKPAPGPEYGIVHKGAKTLGDRSWWQQLKSAYHGGAKSLRAMQWQPGEWLAEDHLWIEEGFCASSTSTKIVNRLRPPSRWKARNLDHVRLICGADAFIETVMRGIQRGLI